MSFQSKASTIFPKAVWTGGSSIHASIAAGANVPLPFSEPRKVMAAMYAANFGGYIQRIIMKACPDMEWLMSSDSFQDLLMVDFYRFLHGLSSIHTDKKLTNPKTGNTFHRVAMLEEQGIVGGVRVWIMSVGEDEVHIGFRFRLEQLDSSPVKVRGKALALTEEVEPEAITLKEYVSKETEVPQVEFADFLK